RSVDAFARQKQGAPDAPPAAEGGKRRAQLPEPFQPAEAVESGDAERRWGDGFVHDAGRNASRPWIQDAGTQQPPMRKSHAFPLVEVPHVLSRQEIYARPENRAETSPA